MIRQLDLDTLMLESGAHSPDSHYCLLEAVAFVAGEDWTDHPRCVSPVLATFGRNWNDSLDDVTRQRLKTFIPRLVGTAGDDEADERRSWMALDWLVRVQASSWLELAGLHSHAAALKTLGRITPKTINGYLPTIRAARAAARTAARDAARTAAWAAASDAAWAAARDAAALRPAIVMLQESAFDLFSNMIDA